MKLSHDLALGVIIIVRLPNKPSCCVCECVCALIIINQPSIWYRFLSPIDDEELELHIYELCCIISGAMYSNKSRSSDNESTEISRRSSLVVLYPSMVTRLETIFRVKQPERRARQKRGERAKIEIVNEMIWLSFVFSYVLTFFLFSLRLSVSLSLHVSTRLTRDILS